MLEESLKPTMKGVRNGPKILLDTVLVFRWPDPGPTGFRPALIFVLFTNLFLFFLQKERQMLNVASFGVLNVIRRTVRLLQTHPKFYRYVISVAPMRFKIALYAVSKSLRNTSTYQYNSQLGMHFTTLH